MELGISVGIDASRNRSGGAINHLMGILGQGDPRAHGVNAVHLWSYKALIDKLPDAPWLVKHNPPELERSLFHQIWWQYHQLPRELRRYQCDILFASDAGTVCLYDPMVAFSQCALCYEPGMTARFGISPAGLRLLVLFFVQNRSMRHADGVIFLTRYAANLIQRSTGHLRRTAIIPHGVDPIFDQSGSRRAWPGNDGQAICCTYVSDVAMYKNQWTVVRAIRKLRDSGHNLELLLAGGGSRSALRLLKNEISELDPQGSFVRLRGHVPHEELPNLLAGSDIFIFASSCETISITLMEAMVSGLPIACSNRGPMPEVLGDGGVYFDPEDSASIADAVMKLISDRHLRERIAIRAKTLSNQYHWCRCAADTWKFLVEIVGGAKK